MKKRGKFPKELSFPFFSPDKRAAGKAYPFLMLKNAIFYQWFHVQKHKKIIEGSDMTRVSILYILHINVTLLRF